ncbi:MAG: molybdenum ABC transporter permease [Desulfococcus sp. 4484_241]|nr:MAG: molybdenum ABC transporter permease [Desulfococcus sp. 4484_241]RLC33921.1 MAG: molybdenum ABC transporter permease [Deltaproteobacteria bacterium]
MRSFGTVLFGLGFILVLFVAMPLVRMILAADPAVLKGVLAETRVYQSILLTLRAALWATLLCAVCGVPLAYILARRQFPGKSLVEGIIDLPIMIPHTAAGIALLMVYGKSFLLGRLFSRLGVGFVGTEAGISLAMAFVSVPFLVNSAKDGFLAIDPRLERVARTLGASPWRVFLKVSLPLAWRSILSGAIMMWARGISEFGAVVVLAYHPMTAPVLIWERFGAYGLKYARPVAVVLILICLIIFFVLRALSAKQEEN